MGYLDDLKKQAQVIREEQQGPGPEEQQQAAVERALQLSLRLIYGYLRELKEQLSVVKPDVSVDYDIEGFRRLADLRQGDYTLHVDDPKVIGDLALSFLCSHPDGRPRIMRTRDRSAFLKQRDYLWRHGLKFDSKLAVSSEGTFLLEPMVPVSLRFLPDPKARRIRFVINNLDSLGEDTYLIDPLRLKRQHLDGITGLVLRKPGSLERLTGPLISDDAKTRIRQALAEERKQQERHEAKAAAISQAEQEVAAQKRVPARIRRASMTALARLSEAAAALWSSLRPHVLNASQWGVDRLKHHVLKIFTQIHTHLHR